MTDYVSVENLMVYGKMTFTGDNLDEIRQWIGPGYETFIGSNGLLYVFSSSHSGSSPTPQYTYRVYSPGQELIAVTGGYFLTPPREGAPQRPVPSFGLVDFDSYHTLVEKDSVFPITY